MLRRGSKGFHNASAPKNVLKVTNMACYGENDNMNQVVRGIDFEVQSDNPGAVALYFHGAQGATIQDVTIRLAPDSFAGIGGGPGAGGGAASWTRRPSALYQPVLATPSAPPPHPSGGSFGKRTVGGRVSSERRK